MDSLEGQVKTFFGKCVTSSSPKQEWKDEQFDNIKKVGATAVFNFAVKSLVINLLCKVICHIVNTYCSFSCNILLLFMVVFMQLNYLTAA